MFSCKYLKDINFWIIFTKISTDALLFSSQEWFEYYILNKIYMDILVKVKAGSLDSISDHFSFVKFDDDWDDSMKNSSKVLTQREKKIKKRVDFINLNMRVCT